MLAQKQNSGSEIMKQKLPTGVVAAIVAVVAVGAAFLLYTAFAGGGSSTTTPTSDLTKEMTKDNNKYEPVPEGANSDMMSIGDNQAAANKASRGGK